jgi:lipopolysaccharide export system permease protein
VTPAPGGPPPSTVTAAPVIPVNPGAIAPSAGVSSSNFELVEAHDRIEEARYRRNRADIEIQKKFSLAFACIVFVLVGAPLALRFPRGGVGLVIGASFVIFGTFYVGLIGGESLANKSLISPFWAMWADNVIFVIVGALLISRMGHEGVTGRSGNFGEFFSRLFHRA